MLFDPTSQFENLPPRPPAVELLSFDSASEGDLGPRIALDCSFSELFASPAAHAANKDTSNANNDSPLSQLTAHLGNFRFETSSYQDPRHFPYPQSEAERIAIIAKYHQSWTPAYRRLIDNVSRWLPPLHKNCELSACLPVAASQEAGHIFHTLEALSRQTAGRESFEVVLLFNYTDQQLRENRPAIQDCWAEIKRAQRSFGDRLSCFTAPLEITSRQRMFETPMTIGLLRSIVSDAVVQRLQNYGGGRDHLLWRADADTRATHRDLFAGFLEYFKENPQRVALEGRLYWSPETAVQDPNLLFNVTLHNAFHIVHRIIKKQRRVYILQDRGGPNFVVRASAYAALGGYNDTMRDSEDCDFDARCIEVARELTPSGGRSSSTITSSRRADHALRTKGKICSEQWNDDATPFGLDNHDIRNSPTTVSVIGELPHPKDPELLENLSVTANAHLRTALRPVLRRDRLRITQKVLGTLGMEFEIASHRYSMPAVAITDAKGFLSYCAEMRKQVAAGTWRDRFDKPRR